MHGRGGVNVKASLLAMMITMRVEELLCCDSGDGIVYVVSETHKCVKRGEKDTR